MNEPADDLALLLQALEDQQQSIDLLVGQYEQLTKRVERAEKAPAATAPAAARADGSEADWLRMDPPQRAELLRRLAPFVEELVTSYRMAEFVRPCWWRHGAAVGELAALRGGHEVAYAPSSDASMPSWWHDLLERTQTRLRRILVKCRDGHHEPQATEWAGAQERAAFARELECLRREER